MATNYPGALDTLTNPASTDRLTSPSHAAQHANANDAIEAIQATLGTNPQGSESTVSARIAALEGGSGFSVVGFTNQGDGTTTGAVEDFAVSGPIVLTSTADVVFSATLQAEMDWITDGSAFATYSAVLVDNANADVATISADHFIGGPGYTQTLTLSGRFASVATGTYTVEIRHQVSGGRSARSSINGFVLY